MDITVRVALMASVVGHLILAAYHHPLGYWVLFAGDLIAVTAMIPGPDKKPDSD